MREEIRHGSKHAIEQISHSSSAHPSDRLVVFQFLAAGVIIVFSHGLEVLLERMMDLSRSSHLSIYGVAGAATVFWAIPRSVKHLIVIGTVAIAVAILLMVGGAFLTMFNQNFLAKDAGVNLMWLTEKGLEFAYVVSILFGAIHIFRRLGISR